MWHKANFYWTLPDSVSTWAALWQHNAAKIGTIYRSPEICNFATEGFHWFQRKFLSHRTYFLDKDVDSWCVAVTTLNGDSDSKEFIITIIFMSEFLGLWLVKLKGCSLLIGWHGAGVIHGDLAPASPVSAYSLAYFIRTHTYLLITPRLAITTPPLCRHKTHHLLSKQYQHCQMQPRVIKLLHNEITRE